MTLFADIAQLEAEGRPFVLCTVMSVQGSTPQKPGSRLVVLADGALRGTIGGGAIEKQVVDAALALLSSEGEETKMIETHLTHDLGMCCGGRMTVFLEKHGAPVTLFVFGAGHVAKELAQLAHRVGFQVTVVDERSEWLNAERFPFATRRLEQPDVVAKSLSGGAHTYCCVTTHDHPLDQACIEALVKTPLAYLGVIGSKRKALMFRQRMTAGGFSEAEVERFESPMGVDISALTPAEIAVSIVGRLIAVRRAR
ncbi:MAG: xanthine dehydrogenase accessory protein XdhC [Archangium sp.]